MESPQSSTRIELASEERSFEQRGARWWPLAVLFAAFSTLPAACHWPYPDPREPIIQSDGRDSNLEPTTPTSDTRTPAANADSEVAERQPL